ncbi:TPA: hypothetical protein JBB93_08270 [Legionella pneumophila subsp. pneumophila]|nr:hypothetical protein LPC_2021 [Legionella pneumophila str. Corby]ADG25837.1 hypothetical protein lpa_03582 [Legionella pneumophila 2300/99 Alcoy]HAT8058080.1 hypothetical protein [Legionella pneumophila]HAT8842804.1 hypothetical protein [Legionella pneumophila subsp. pneumophila]HAT8060987.1 hypothetical protein [Legionella pneumophila]
MEHPDWLNYMIIIHQDLRKTPISLLKNVINSVIQFIAKLSLSPLFALALRWSVSSVYNQKLSKKT